MGKFVFYFSILFLTVGVLFLCFKKEKIVEISMVALTGNKVNEEIINLVPGLEIYDSAENKPLSQRDMLVQEKLERFKAQTNDITPESIALERQQINEKLQEIQNRPPLEPKIIIVKDEFGKNWQKLDYGDGIIRYDF
jgi:hypothetical protein